MSAVNCPVCSALDAHAAAVQAARQAQDAWERRHADLADSYRPSAVPDYMLAGLGERPPMPTPPPTTIEQRLQHMEHRLDRLDAIADGKEA